MNKKNFLIVILLFFLKIFTTKCESRKIQLIVVVNNKVYRYYSSKNIDPNKKYNFWSEKFDTDFTVNDNKIDLKDLEQKIKNNELELVGKNNFSDDINDPIIKSNLENYIITRYYIFTDNERRFYCWKIYDDLESPNNKVFDIPSYNINKEAYYYIEIPKDINHIFVFLEDKKNLGLIKKGDIKHISFKYDGTHLSEKEDYIELSENIKLSDYFTKDKNIKIFKYSKNNQICNFINDKILKNEKFKDNVVKLKNITKAGDEEFKFEDIVNKGGFIDKDFYIRDKDLNSIDSDDDKKKIEQKDMYIDCKLKFRKNINIIFNIPEGTKLDQGLKMKQKALLELDSFNQKVIEKTLLETILKISINKQKIDGSENLHLCDFWKGYEGLWVEKYEIIDRNGNIISTVIGPNDNNYIDFSDNDNIVFKIYLTPGSEILEGIFVHLHFIAPDGKFISSQLLKSPQNEYISNNQVVFLNNVFLDDDDRTNNNNINHKRGNYLKQLKKILKEGYFNKQKISLDEDCYKFVKDKYNSEKKKWEYIDIDLDFSCDPYDVKILFNDKSINKYIKNNKADQDPIYYGNGDQRTIDNKPFDDKYEYDYKYHYQPVTGDFDNYYVNKTYKIKSFKNGSANSSDYIDYEISDYTETQNEYKETKTPKIDKNLGCCAKCMSKCCCFCKRNV